MKTPHAGRFPFLVMQLLRVSAHLGLLLVLLGWLQPLHVLPWVSWHSEVPVFAGVLLAASVGLVTCWRGGTKVFPIPLGVWWLLGLLAITVLQAATGMIHFLGDAVVLALYLGLCMVCWLLGYHVLAAIDDDPSKAYWPKAVAWTLLAAALISSVIAMVQVLDVWDNLSWINRMPQLRRPGANIGQPNQLGTLLLMGLASLLYLRESGKLSVFSSLPIAALLALAFAASESRTAALGLLLLVFWSLAGHYRKCLKTRPWLLIAGALAFLSLYTIWPMLVTSADKSGMPTHVNINPGMRLLVWPQLLEAVELRPWLGWGMREVSKAHNAVVHAYSSSEPYTYAHNLILEAALGMGLPLTLLAAVTAAYWIYQRTKKSVDLMAWYGLAVALPLGVHSMLEFPFAYAYFLAPVMVLLGMLDARIKGKTAGGHTVDSQLEHMLDARIKGKTAGRIGVKSATAGLVLIAVTGAWTIVEYLNIEEDFRVARFEAMRVGLTPEKYERPKVLLLTQLDALLTAARAKPTATMTSDQIDLLRSVALRYPWPATQSRYALALVLNGQEAEGLRQLNVMRAMHGEKNYLPVKDDWKRLGEEKYPRLLALEMP